MVLWIIFTALIAFALAALLWQLLAGERGKTGEDGVDIVIYEDQLGEIEADLARGVIGAEEAKAARLEVSRRLLAAAGERPGRARGSKQRALKPETLILAGSILTVPVLGLVLYLGFGSPGLPGQPHRARLQAPAAGANIASLIARVEAELREQPQDGWGWDVIAPVYLRRGRFEDAANAYERALAILGETPDRLEAYGEARTLADNGIVTDRARAALERALARDEGRLKARFWLGTALEQDGKFAEAAAAWRALLKRGGEGSPWRTMVRERLKFAEAKQQAPSGSGASTGPGEKGPSRRDIERARVLSPGERSAMINRMVDGLAARLAENGKDLRGWLRLTRSYIILGRREAAADALRDAKRHFDGDAEALAELQSLAEELGL